MAKREIINLLIEDGRFFSKVNEKFYKRICEISLKVANLDDGLDDDDVLRTVMAEFGVEDVRMLPFVRLILKTRFVADKE